MSGVVGSDDNGSYRADHAPGTRLIRVVPPSAGGPRIARADRRRVGRAVLKGDPDLPPDDLRSAIKRGRRLTVYYALSPVPMMIFGAVLVALTGGSYFTTVLGGGIGLLCLAIFHMKRLKSAQEINQAALTAKDGVG